MCKVLGVSRSGYYAWRKRKPGKRWNENELLLGRIQEIYEKNRRVYGSPRVTEELREQGNRCGKNRIARIMKDNGIRAEVKRRFKKTTDSKHNYSLAANLLIQDGYQGPLWASDITFVPTREGWLYVSAVMSVQSRKIIGLSMNDQLSEELAATALKQAVTREKPSEGLIHHSDRGRQYASYGYQGLLKRYGITPSMSRKGNCYDNAYMESFFSTLKRELVHGERYRTREDARLSIFEYVEVFYNRTRKHSALGYKSPEQYEKSLEET
jgi:transposase InsO family protein